MPDQWSKLLTKSAITREDYAKDPQAVLDVLEFYTDHQKRELEDMGMRSGSAHTSSTSTAVNSNTNSLSLPYSSMDSAPARFNAGTGLGGTGIGKISSPLGLSTSPSVDSMRPMAKRQDTAPAMLGLNGDSTNLSSAAARAAELVNGSGARPGIGLPGGPQASRPAPPRPLLTGNRPAPPKPDHTPSSADLRARQKAHGPPVDPTKVSVPLPSLPVTGQIPTQGPPPSAATLNQGPSQTQEPPSSQASGSRPVIGVPAKSSPATTFPATQPAGGAAGATPGPPPVKPLQPLKKAVAPAATPAITFATPSEGPGSGGSVAAAAAALEKPKDKEKRISTMTEVQIMEKLRSVVSDDDPKLLYSKIKKVGQG
jgi:hypothetical protein